MMAITVKADCQIILRIVSISVLPNAIAMARVYGMSFEEIAAVRGWITRRAVAHFMRRYHRKTLREIGETLGVSRQRVHQILALEKARETVCR